MSLLRESSQRTENIEKVVRKASELFKQQRMKREEEELKMSKQILLFVPNIIGYIRLILIFSAFLLSEKPIWLLTLYSLSAILDWFDGYAARCFDQVSAFGALLDVVVDNIGRGMLWCQMFSWGYFVNVIEWLTLVSTHCKGANWKTLEGSNPWIVQKVMENGFKTVTGFCAVSGLHVLPIWLYAYQTGILSEVFIPKAIQLFGIIVLTMARLLCLRVELITLTQHVAKRLYVAVSILSISSAAMLTNYAVNPANKQLLILEGKERPNLPNTKGPNSDNDL